MDRPAMKIAIDLDGTISEYSEFFRVFSRAMTAAGCQIHVVTDRVPGTERAVRKELAFYGIACDVIKITADKAGYVQVEGINVLFDDMECYFAALPAKVAVFKVRQKYNFDFDRGRWRQ